MRKHSFPIRRSLLGEREERDYRGSPNSSASFGAGASLAGSGAVASDVYTVSKKKLWGGAALVAVGAAAFGAGMRSGGEEMWVSAGAGGVFAAGGAYLLFNAYEAPAGGV